MKNMKYFVFGLTLCAAVSATAAVNLKDGGWQKDSDANKDGKGDTTGIPAEPGSMSSYHRYVMIDNGKFGPYFSYNGMDDPALLPKGKTFAGKDLCLYIPTMNNPGWYSNGFLDISVNGVSVKDYKPEISSENKGSSGIINYVWDMDAAKVKMTLTLQDGADNFSVSCALDPKKEITSIQVRTLCIPSSFTQPADRMVVTPTRELSPGQEIKIEPSKEFWLVYGDKKFDRKNDPKTSDGPCALLFPPAEPSNVAILLNNYDIVTTLSYPPTTKELNLVFWPSLLKTNEEAVSILRGLSVSK